MQPDQLTSTFAALADPTRRAILARLAQVGEATVNDLAEPFPISLQAVSKHLKVLEAAGLITRARDAQYRPCRLRTGPLDSAAGWIDQHRRQWQERLDRFDQTLREVQRERADRRATTQPVHHERTGHHTGARHHEGEETP